MTEPKWPTGEEVRKVIYRGGRQTLAPGKEITRTAIEMCELAFAEWRTNLLIEIQKPGPSGVQPPSFEQVQIDVLTDRITKLERRLKRVGKMSAKAWNLADEANKVAWAVDETTRPLTTEATEATEPPAVSHTRLADEIRGAGTKAPVMQSWPLCGEFGPIPLPGRRHLPKCALKAGHPGPHEVADLSDPSLPEVYRWDRALVEVVDDDDPDADELPTDTQCKAVNDREPQMMCHLGIGHVGDHHGQLNGYGRFWDTDQLPKAVLCGIASIRFPERLCGMAKGHHGPVHQDAEGNGWRRDSSFVPAADTQCRVIAMRLGITYNCQLTRGHDGQHDGTSGQLRHQWTSP